MSDSGLIEITRQPVSPERLINLVKTDSSGCVVSYVGLIRNSSRGKVEPQ
jgi:molybdopterin synthase catalytic subunit